MRDRLVDLLRVPIYPKEGADPAEVVADYLLDSGVVVPQCKAEDVVEVVRCKDCDVPHNKWTGCPNLNGMIPPPDFYCARGERKQQTDVDTDIYVGNKSECNVCSRITEANKDIFWTFARTHQPEDKDEFRRVPARYCPVCGCDLLKNRPLEEWERKENRS